MSEYKTIAHVGGGMQVREAETIRQAIDDFLWFVGEHEDAPVYTLDREGEIVLRENFFPAHEGIISLWHVRREHAVN